MKSLYKSVIQLHRYRGVIITMMIAIVLFWGMYLFTHDPKEKIEFITALNYTLNLFIDPVPGQYDNLHLEIVSIIAKATIFFTVISFFIQSLVERLYRRYVLWRGDHILVIGLDKSSRFLINSELDKGNDNIVIIESDPNHHHTQRYKNMALSVIISEIDNVLTHINIDQARYIFISTGDDKKNIYAALKIIETAKQNRTKKLLVHIENRTLRSLYNDHSLLDGRSLNRDYGNKEHEKRLDMRPFSYHKESARLLFQTHDIDGENLDIIHSTKAFEIAVIGNSTLAIEVIAEAIKVSHLPNKNHLTINCIDRDIQSFKQRVEYEFAYSKNLPHITFNYVELDHHDIGFYHHTMWKQEPLKQIIFCYDESVTNIQVATKLKRITYKEQLDNQKRKIHVATYSDVQLSKELSKLKNDILVFATADLVSTTENLVNTEIGKLAKLIHYSYSLPHLDKAAIDSQEEVNRVWERDITINDRRSSIAQAIHINMKLKALGLKRRKSDRPIEKLIILNNLIFDKKVTHDLEQLQLTKEQLASLSFDNPTFFPKDYTTCMERLLNAEHNRWIAMQIMMDNRYDPAAKDMPNEERKIKKIHHLMKPLQAFSEDEHRYIIYDLYSIFYIPEYMASIGYEIVEY